MSRKELCSAAGAGEGGHEVAQVHVVHGGVAASQQVEEVEEELGVAGDAQRAAVGVPELRHRQPEQVLHQPVVQVVRLHLHPPRHRPLRPHYYPDVPLRQHSGRLRRREIPRSAANKQLPHQARHPNRH